MESTSLTTLAAEQLGLAHQHHNGRAARTILSGGDHVLRHTVVALIAGRELAEHDAPGEATLQVLLGDVQLIAGAQVWDGESGDFVRIPPVRHSLIAKTDAAVLLTINHAAQPAAE